jgi:hypothetical protein
MRGADAVALGVVVPAEQDHHEPDQLGRGGEGDASAPSSRFERFVVGRHPPTLATRRAIPLYSLAIVIAIWQCAYMVIYPDTETRLRIARETADAAHGSAAPRPGRQRLRDRFLTRRR